MAKLDEAVFDTGPFIHLHDVQQLELLSLFQTIRISEEVMNELKGLQEEILKYKHVQLTKLEPKSKDFAKYVTEKYNVDLGEATSIAVCWQERIKHFFTDDLEARETAHTLGFEVHGTLALVLRSLREKVLSKKETMNVVEELYKKSSLFLTKDLVDWIMKEIEAFEQKV